VKNDVTAARHCSIVWRPRGLRAARANV
jgi:hypothetical protein